MSPLRIAVVLSLASLGLVGCGPNVSVDFVSRTSPPVPATVSPSRIQLAVGIAAAVNLEPKEDGEDMPDDTRVSLWADDASVLGVSRAIEDHSFVLYGVSQGSTFVHLAVDGDEVDTIPASVVSQ